MTDEKEKRRCGECKHFLGGSDWGLSCDAYYMRVVAEDTDCTKCIRFKRKTLGTTEGGEKR